MIYAHGDLNDRLDVLQIPVEGTFVYENYHIYAGTTFDINSDAIIVYLQRCDNRQSYKCF